MIPRIPRGAGKVVARFPAYMPKGCFAYSPDMHLIIRLAVDPEHDEFARVLRDHAGKDLWIEVRAREVDQDEAIAALIAAAEGTS